MVEYQGHWMVEYQDYWMVEYQDYWMVEYQGYWMLQGHLSNVVKQHIPCCQVLAAGLPKLTINVT